MKRIFTLAMLLLAFDAHAQQVHKCVGRSGGVAYQSQPCGDAQTTVRSWKAPPDPVSEPPSSIPATASRQKHGNAAATVAPARRKHRRVMGASIPVENSGNSRACVSAKATRTRTLERVGLKRTFDLLRRLDDAVHSACN